MKEEKKDTITKEELLTWLEEVKDPEIPVISLIDLGVITDAFISEKGFVSVEMTPTFVGCPAIDYMKKDVESVLKEHGITHFEVNVTLEKPWSSNMISEKGKEALKKFGLAPPPKHDMIIDLDIIKHTKCPYCHSEDTELKSPFGPTLCRSLHYCNHCKQAFEQFKPI